MRACPLGFAQFVLDPLPSERARQTLAAVAAWLVRRAGRGRRSVRGWGIAVVVCLARLVLFQFGDDLLDVPAGGLALQGEQEQLPFVDLLALLPEAPFEKLLENVLHTLQSPLMHVQLRGQIDHHLPQ